MNNITDEDNITDVYNIGSNSNTIFWTAYKGVFYLFSLGLNRLELPPYFIAKNLNSKKSIKKLFNLLGNSNAENTINNITKKLKTNNYTRFLIIMGFAAWPNAIFDMCGVAAGLIKLPIYQFLVPTIIGKAFIKTPIQLGFVIYSYMYFGSTFETNEKTSYFYWCWICVVILFTLYFIKEAIENYIN